MSARQPRGGTLVPGLQAGRAELCRTVAEDLANGLDVLDTVNRVFEVERCVALGWLIDCHVV
jgi:hypothetical protein